MTVQQQRPKQSRNEVTPRADTLDGFCHAFCLGRTTVYAEIASGRLSTYTIGRARRISADAAEAWQRAREAEGAQ